MTGPAAIGGRVEELLGQKPGLLGVVGDGAGRRQGRVGLLGGGVHESGDRPVEASNAGWAQGLGGHAQGVTQGETRQGPGGTVMAVVG